MNMWKSKVCCTGMVIGIAGMLNAQDPANDDPNKGKEWSRSVKNTTELKKETSAKGDDINAKGNVIMGTSDGPSVHQTQNNVVGGPSEEDIKKIGQIQGQVVSIDGVIDGTSDSPYALTDEEIKMLNSNGDIVLCGESGEIVNTNQWKEPGKACKMTGFKFGAPRHQLIFIGEICRLKGDKNAPCCFSDEEMKLLREHKNITISGKTGEFVGTKDWDKSIDPDPQTGFNRQSPRQAILIHYKVIKAPENKK